MRREWHYFKGHYPQKLLFHIAKGIGVDAGYYFTRYDQHIEMTTCWVNVMPPLSHHSLHLHPLSFISGTYYVDTPKGCGQIKFEDPRLGLFMAAPPRKVGAPASMAPFYAITPKAGEVVLFESWLRHEVTANQARTPRVSVSFNYEWVQTEAGC